MKIEDVAKICYEANRSYCQCLGDNSQPTWEEAEEWQIKFYLDGILFYLSNPDLSYKDNHENWLKHKKENGWKFGPVKNIEKKEHPYMIPFDELPQEQKTKDAIFSSIIKILRKFNNITL